MNGSDLADIGTRCLKAAVRAELRSYPRTTADVAKVLFGRGLSSRRPEHRLTRNALLLLEQEGEVVNVGNSWRLPKEEAR